MKRLRFISTSRLKHYHYLPESFYDGDEHDVKDAEAERILKDFPDNFKVVAPGSSKKEEPKPEKKAENLDDAKDKSVKTEDLDNKSVRVPDTKKGR